jgi:hypothetical protein
LTAFSSSAVSPVRKHAAVRSPPLSGTRPETVCGASWP